MAKIDNNKEYELVKAKFQDTVIGTQKSSKETKQFSFGDLWDMFKTLISNELEIQEVTYKDKDGNLVITKNGVEVFKGAFDRIKNIIPSGHKIAEIDKGTSKNIDLYETITNLKVEGTKITYTNEEGKETSFSLLEGKKGEDGKDGTNGVNGKNGLNGRNGRDGQDGKDGVDGKNGINGKDGSYSDVRREGNDLVFSIGGEEVRRINICCLDKYASVDGLTSMDVLESNAVLNGDSYTGKLQFLIKGEPNTDYEVTIINASLRGFNISVDGMPSGTTRYIREKTDNRGVAIFEVKLVWSRRATLKKAFEAVYIDKWKAMKIAIAP